jgi:hypothetical protein
MIRNYFPGVLLMSAALLCVGCGEKPDSKPTRFTKADSLMDSYLGLQDSMLQVWNTMINDDNRKIQAMHDLVHELMVSGTTDPEAMKAYENRLGRLKNLRYTQFSMSNPDVITEYDFASNTLVTELISLAESQKQFAYNTTLQKLVDQIRIADERVMSYRQTYDEIAARYNDFLNENRQFLKENDTDSLQEKPLFQFAADE